MADKEELTTLTTGSTRSKLLAGQKPTDPPLRYDLISPVGLRRLAARYGKGAETHGPFNWEKGQPADVVVNHMMAHLYQFLAGDRTDDHLAAVAWGTFALMHYQELKPEMLSMLRPVEAA